jgi:hypothetical protein
MQRWLTTDKQPVDLPTTGFVCKTYLRPTSLVLEALDAELRFVCPKGHFAAKHNCSLVAASRPLMALERRFGRGQAGRLCSCSSDVDLFGYGESVVDLNAEVAHRALNLLVPQ